MTIAATSFALVDTETTGPDTKTAELVEVACHLRRPGFAWDRYTTLVFPIGDVPPEASAIHHLTDEDLIGQPGADQVLEKLDGFVPADAVMVAHNAPFDRAMLPVLDNRRWLCTERLAHHIVPDAPNFKLQTLRYYLRLRKIDLEGQEPHRADADLIVLRKVFEELLLRYAVMAADRCAGDAKRYENSQQIDTLLEYIARPYVIKRMMFGKHRGEPLESVPEGYVRWMLKTDVDADLRWNLERRLKGRVA